MSACPRLLSALLVGVVSFPAMPALAVAPQEAASTDEETDIDDADVVVTATRTSKRQLHSPAAVSVLRSDALTEGANARSLPDALSREPGVLLQKTGPGQSSPYIRGFTGFRTLFLVDGVRLNNSVWRDGPNQYTGTVDQYSAHSLELVRGPGSVLWGSDAIGGVVNVLTGAADASDGWKLSYSGRASTGERSWYHRLAVEGGEAPGDGASFDGRGWALRAGVTRKDFGAINAGRGSGDLHGTSYDEMDFDLRLDLPVHERADLSIVMQSVRQEDVPRTHKTVDAVPWHGTTPGKELRRELDQDRDLAYARLSFESLARSLYDEGEVTLSWQRHREQQDRLRTGGRRDLRGFEVETLGVQAQMSKDTTLGLFTWGLEHFRDDVTSSREDFVGGVSTGPQIQGPIGDNSSYDVSGVFLQDEIVHGEYGDWETTIGARWSRAHAQSDRVDNPNVPGSSPATPGNILKLDETWDDLTASIRTLHHISDQTVVYAALAEGFRAPNLSDLTSDLEDSGAESPAPELEPEHFLTVEMGAKTEADAWNGEAAVYYTWIDDMIVRSPTGGTLADGTPIVQKSNVGDGFVYGIELRGERRLDQAWTAFGAASWQKGRVDQFRPGGQETRGPMSRGMPLSGVVGVTYEPPDSDWWVQADVYAAEGQSDLSLRDKTDTSRIPPGGTPGFAVVGIRGSKRVSDRASIGLALENLFDKDYRIHGSGQNEPGRSLVLTYRLELGLD